MGRKLNKNRNIVLQVYAGLFLGFFLIILGLAIIVAISLLLVYYLPDIQRIIACGNSEICSLYGINTSERVASIAFAVILIFIPLLPFLPLQKYGIKSSSGFKIFSLIFLAAGILLLYTQINTYIVVNDKGIIYKDMIADWFYGNKNQTILWEDVKSIRYQWVPQRTFKTGFSANRYCDQIALLELGEGNYYSPPYVLRESDFVNYLISVKNIPIGEDLPTTCSPNENLRIKPEL